MGYTSQLKLSIGTLNTTARLAPRFHMYSRNHQTLDSMVTNSEPLCLRIILPPSIHLIFLRSLGLDN